MRVFIKLFFLSLIFGLCFSGSVVADPYSKTISVFKQSEAVEPFFHSSYGYAVFPTIGKVGIAVGGAYGEGKVYEKGNVTGTTSVAKISIGFQLGIQAFSQIIFFQDRRSYQEFVSGNFEFEASASAVAITAGVQAKAGTTGTTAGASTGPATGDHSKTNYHKGMAVFVHTKGGLMYEASIGGQKFSFEPI